MSNVIQLSKAKPLNRVSREIEEAIEDGGGRLVFQFHGATSYKQIVKVIEWMGDEYALKMTIAHAEFKDYLASAAAGAAVGGVIALMLKISGYAISGPMALSIAALMAVWAFLATTLHVRLYKFQGSARLSVVV